MTIQLGVVGPGLIWHHSHRHALAQQGDRVQVAAVCARSAATLDNAGVPDARRYSSIDELLAAPDLDAVLVLTPIALNAPTAIAALRAGKTVFLEKPAAISLEQGYALLEAEQASGTHVYVLEQAAYGAPLLTMQRLLAERQLGTLVLYDRISHGLLDAGTHDCGGYGKTLWRQRAEFPLGSLFDGGIHEIAELTRLFGVPSSVSASGGKWRKGFGAYDEILMQFSYGSGLRGIFSHSAALPGVHHGFTIRGTTRTLRPNGHSLQLADMDNSTSDVPIDTSMPGMWAQVLDAYEKRVEAPYSLCDAVQDVAVLHAVAKTLDTEREAQVTLLAGRQAPGP